MKLKTKEPMKIVNRFSYLSPDLEIVSAENGIARILARASVSRGETVGIYGGKVTHKDQLQGLSGLTVPHRISKDFYLVSPIHDDGIDSIHWIRKSENPNTGFQGDITLVALRDIEAGEEITIHPAMQDLGYSLSEEGKMVRDRFRSNLPSYIQKEIQSRPELQSFDGFADGAWGLLSSIDLESCNPETIRSADAIREYVYKLCDLIEMKRFGECHVVHFGEDERVAGYSMFQLIETSCISAHFANETNTSYIDIFSCKAYDPKVAAEFTRKYFEGDSMRVTVTNRF